MKPGAALAASFIVMNDASSAPHIILVDLVAVDAFIIVPPRVCIATGMPTHATSATHDVTVV